MTRKTIRQVARVVIETVFAVTVFFVFCLLIIILLIMANVLPW